MRVERYRCGELEVEARYLGDGGTLELLADGRRERLPRVPATSGFKYERGIDERYRLFWSKGATARLALGSDAWRACRRLPGEPSDEAAKGVPESLFRALGNEPPWTLSIGTDVARLDQGYDPETTLLPRTAVLFAVDGTTLGRSVGVPELVVEAESGLCRDDMSGMPYPFAVTLAHEAGTLSGCGGEPASLLLGATPEAAAAALRGERPGEEGAAESPWEIERVGEERVLDEAPATLSFEAGGRLSGSGGCNRFVGLWHIDGESLGIGSLAATRRACPRSVLAQESRLLAWLAEVRRFDLDADGALVLLATDGEIVARRRRMVP